MSNTTNGPIIPTPQDYLDAAKAWVDVTGGEVWPGSHRHTAQRPELRAAVDSAFVAGWRARDERRPIAYVVGMNYLHPSDVAVVYPDA